MNDKTGTIVSGDFARAGRSHNIVGWGGKSSGTWGEVVCIQQPEISPVAALPGNPKRSTLMKMNFQRADLFVLV